MRRVYCIFANGGFLTFSGKIFAQQGVMCLSGERMGTRQMKIN